MCSGSPLVAGAAADPVGGVLFERVGGYLQRRCLSVFAKRSVRAMTFRRVPIEWVLPQRA